MAHFIVLWGNEALQGSEGHLRLAEPLPRDAGGECCEFDDNPSSDFTGDLKRGNERTDVLAKAVPDKTKQFYYIPYTDFKYNIYLDDILQGEWNINVTSKLS